MGDCRLEFAGFEQACDFRGDGLHILGLGMEARLDFFADEVTSAPFAIRLRAEDSEDNESAEREAGDLQEAVCVAQLPSVVGCDELPRG